MAKKKYINPKASSNVYYGREIDVQKMGAKELRAYVQNEGKRLNQQLAELQKRGYTDQSFAYSKLTETPRYAEFLGLSKSGKVKINLNTRGKSRSQLQRVANIIQRFANTKTITISGIKDYYKNVFSTLRGKYEGFGDLTDEQLANILKTDGFTHAKGVLGSDTIFKMIHQAADVDFMEKYLENIGDLKTREAAEVEFDRMQGLLKGFTPVPDDVVIPF